MILNAGMTKEIALVCAGEKFNPQLHVLQIYRKLKLHCTNFRLTVLTDNPGSVNIMGLPIRTVLLPDWGLAGPRNLWWYKIAIFNPELEWKGPVLYMDLDTIIVKNIDKFFDYNLGKFCICQDFNRKFAQEYPVSNSSIMRFEPGGSIATQLYNIFCTDRKASMRKFRGDQDYITDFRKNRDDMEWWPTEWAMSWKWEIMHGGAFHGRPMIDAHDYHNLDVPYIIPDDCSIVVFHGYPGPFETEFGEQQIIG